MIPEHLLIRFFLRDKENFIKYNHVISNVVLDKEIMVIFSTIEKYYTVIPDHNYISFDEFVNFFILKHGTLKDKDTILNIAKQIYDTDVSDSLILEVIKNVIEKDTANKIVQKLLPILTENKHGVLASVDEDLKNYLSIISQQDRTNPFSNKTLEELIEQYASRDGLHWRLNCLNEDIGPLHGAYLGHVFARPDTGKTSFICSELSYMARQLKDDENIVWFCNEESAGRIQFRLFSTLLNVTKEKVINHKDKAREKFNELGGNKIHFVDGCTQMSVVRNVCFEYKPKLIVIDSGDKISFPGDKAYDAVNRLGELYWKYRLLANEFQTPVITVAQACAEVAGKKWLEMHHMNNSKTGKSAEMDFVIGIGRVLDGEEDGIRYINIPKNKLNGFNGKHAIKFNSRTGRYNDL